MLAVIDIACCVEFFTWPITNEIQSKLLKIAFIA